MCSKCCICHEAIDFADRTYLICKHEAHDYCLKKWKETKICKNKCPVCRQHMVDLFPFYKLCFLAILGFFCLLF